MKRTRAGLTHGEAPLPARAHIVVRLAEDWRVDAATHAFRRPGKRASVSLDMLPQGTEVAPLVPELSRSAPKALTVPERDLARTVNVVLPAGEDPVPCLDVLRALECVVSAELAPRPSLP